MKIPNTEGLSIADAAAAWARENVRIAFMKPDGSIAKPWRYASRDKSELLRPPNPDAAKRFVTDNGLGAFAVEPPRNVVVLDIDHRPDRGWFAEQIGQDLKDKFLLPRAPVAKTPSGGFHLWFALPQGFKARNWTSEHGRLGILGVDVRTHGGLVTVPPSARRGVSGKADGAYEWVRYQPIPPLASGALLDALTPPPAPQVTLGSPQSFSGDITRYCESALRRELAAVAHCGKGGRNAQLYKSAAALGSIVAAGGLPDEATRKALFDAAAHCGLINDGGARSVNTTIQSGFLSGQKTPRKLPRERSEA